MKLLARTARRPPTGRACLGVPSSSASRGRGTRARVSSSQAGLGGDVDLSASLLSQLSDAELEDLANEYEYEYPKNKRRAPFGQPSGAASGEDVDDEEDDGAEEVELTYQGMTSEEAHTQSLEFALSLCEELDAVKTQDIALVHVGPHVSWCTYFVLASVFSRPQLEAALGRVAKAAMEGSGRRPVTESRPGRSEWECIDFGDVVVHVMTPRQRKKYNFEGYYSKAELLAYERGELVPHTMPREGDPTPADRI